MRDGSEKICLIIPCFNEAGRLKIHEFKQFISDKTFLIFVDDASTDETAEILRQHVSTHWQVIRLSQNSGKAEAVRQGMLHARGQDFFTDLDWIGFWDADLATPLGEVDHFLTYAQCFYPEAQAIFGSRLRRFGSEIKRSTQRHYLGRFLATLVSLLFGLHGYDTQCGAKLFRPELANQLFTDTFTSSWLFDVELCLRCDTNQTIEYPLLHWQDIEGSKLRIIRVLPRVLGDLVRIYTRYKTGQRKN